MQVAIFVFFPPLLRFFGGLFCAFAFPRPGERVESSYCDSLSRKRQQEKHRLQPRACWRYLIGRKGKKRRKKKKQTRFSFFLFFCSAPPASWCFSSRLALELGARCYSLLFYAAPGAAAHRTRSIFSAPSSSPPPPPSSLLLLSLLFFPMLPRLTVSDTATTFGSDGRAGWLTARAPGLGL